jgi:hypothetical protein
VVIPEILAVTAQMKMAAMREVVWCGIPFNEAL